MGPINYILWKGACTYKIFKTDLGAVHLFCVCTGDTDVIECDHISFVGFDFQFHTFFSIIGCFQIFDILQIALTLFSYTMPVIGSTRYSTID